MGRAFGNNVAVQRGYRIGRSAGQAAVRNKNCNKSYRANNWLSSAKALNSSALPLGS
jgi:hypothetical protein